MKTAKLRKAPKTVTAMSDKLKKILLPAVIIVVCIAVIVTVLVVTLTGKDDDLPHIKIEDGNVQEVRGELDVSLMREGLKTRTLDANGLPVDSEDAVLTDFSKSENNVFGIDGNMLIGPGCYFSADMTIANKKPYVFEYWLEIIPEDGDSILGDQLELTVVIDNETFIKRTLNDKLDTKIFPKVDSGKTAKFTVKLEYLSLENNDDTKNTTLAFDMIVHARLTES